MKAKIKGKRVTAAGKDDFFPEIGELRDIEDVFPTPEELAERNRLVKISINMNKTHLDFFKSLARKQHTKYQKVIRNVMEQFVSAYSHSYQAPKSRSRRRNTVTR